MTVLTRLLCVLIGYLCGLIQTGFFYSKKKDFDLRSQGSGNTGMTNAMRVMGKKAGAIVFAGDVLKCALAMLIVWILYHNVMTADVKLLEFYAAFGVILGHDFPFYLKFRGGKGMSSTAGMFLAMPPMIPFGIAFFLIPVLISRYVSLGSIIVSAALPFIVYFGCRVGWIYQSGTHLPELIILMCVIGILNICRHHANIGRLIHGNENKIGAKKKD